MTRQPAAAVRVVSISMADGSDIDSLEARQRIARALLSVATSTPTDTARVGVQQAKKPA